MQSPKNSNIKPFKSSKELHEWFELNNAKESELWVKIYKKHSKIQSVNWDDVVIESLCWGWIDGIKKSYDEHSYLQRITPRKAKSLWSKRNTQHVEKLISEGRMQASGLHHVNAAKADGRWENAYSVSELKVAVDFLNALEKNTQAKQFYDTLSKSYRNTIAYGLDSAKKPETRQRRFNNFMNKLINGEKP